MLLVELERYRTPLEIASGAIQPIDLCDEDAALELGTLVAGTEGPLHAEPSTSSAIGSAPSLLANVTNDFSLTTNAVTAERPDRGRHLRGRRFHR